MKTNQKKRTRKHDVLDFIVRYAEENNGVTPSTREIAEGLGLCQSRVHHLMTRLVAERWLEWVSRDKYKVVDSDWTFRVETVVS